MKIVVLNGSKNTSKDYIAEKLALNSDVEYIRPYTNKKSYKGVSRERTGGYHYLDSEVLDKKIDSEKVLVECNVKGDKYVFFESQLTHAYNVLILDDTSIIHLKDNWKGDLCTIRCKSSRSESSERFGTYLYDHEFDIIFNVDNDDFDELEAMIV